ncbi:MAG: (Fe-S)-binding protein [Pleurocapsa sp. SU_196_0]|nr:(Fe-S)-binding protein [Pleurocapsa sp. SU_196_0]
MSSATITETLEPPRVPLTLETFTGADGLMAGSDICVQCGVCLSACPTYQLTGEEIQSPRGRVMLYRAAAEGLTKDYEVVLEAAYDCLDCRACQTVCPSGVKPGEMAVETRIALQGGKPPNLKIKAILEPFKYPWAWDAMNLGVRAYQVTGLQRWVRGSRILEKFGRVGRKLAELENILPQKVAPSLRTRVAPVTPAVGEQRGRVAFFLGCLMNAFFSEASSATVRVLTVNGFEVVTPRDTTCCGAPHIEEGDLEGFNTVVKRNLDLYDSLEVDAIITDCAGCGAELKKYVKYFKDDPVYAAKAERFSSKSYGLSEFLKKHGLRDLPQMDAPEMTVTYQDACHLCHGQSVCNQPRDVLKENPLVQYTELENASDCCGGAGIYNITHAHTSQAILEGKMQRVRESGAQVLAVENPGCLMQLEAGTRQFGVNVEVLHTSQILERAYAKKA